MKSFQILDCSVCYKSLSNILWIIFIIKNHWNHGAFYQLIVFESFNLDEVFTSNSIEGEDPDCVARNINVGLPARNINVGLQKTKQSVICRSTKAVFIDY